MTSNVALISLKIAIAVSGPRPVVSVRDIKSDYIESGTRNLPTFFSRWACPARPAPGESPRPNQQLIRNAQFPPRHRDVLQKTLTIIVIPRSRRHVRQVLPPERVEP